MRRLLRVNLSNGAIKEEDRKSTRLNSSHGYISYAVFCLKKKNLHTIIVMCASADKPHIANELASLPSRPRLPTSPTRSFSHTLLKLVLVLFFFFNDTATTEFYPLPLPDALPL